VQLAHAGDQRLARFLIGGHAERRVFAGEALQRHAHLLLVGHGPGLDGHLDHGHRDHHLLEGDDLVFAAQRVARDHILEAHCSGDVAGADFLDVGALAGMHLQQAADALALALGGQVDLVAGLQHAGIHAEEGEVAHERVVQDLERQRRERRLVRRLARGRLAAVIDALGVGQFHRRRHEVDHGVEQGLDPLVLERGAAHAQYDLVLERAGPSGRA
jgi:hypothetical protein